MNPANITAFGSVAFATVAAILTFLKWNGLTEEEQYRVDNTLQFTALVAVMLGLATLWLKLDSVLTMLAAK